MSHYHERKEKICLNCSAALHGRYCHNCGQENTEPRESVWGLVTHFFYDITHFDGKFFNTVRYLIAYPGFLSKEYIAGRRAYYLHPIRMYVFSSAIFFIVFFSRVDEHRLNRDRLANTFDSTMIVAKARNEALKQLGSRSDSAKVEKASDKISAIPYEAERARDGAGQDSLMINIYETKYNNKASYDSAQMALVPALRDSWIRTRLMHKQFDINAMAAKNPGSFFATWLNLFVHSFPQLLFVSLPLFALLLQLLYIRHKRYYYADHAIFSIHLYVFTFVGLLISFLLLEVEDALSWKIFTYLNVILSLYLIYYTYKAMRNFYGQGPLKTFVKYCLLMMSSLAVILILFIFFLVLSILKF